jgi:hypothetical protein
VSVRQACPGCAAAALTASKVRAQTPADPGTAGRLGQGRRPPAAPPKAAPAFAGDAVEHRQGAQDHQACNRFPERDQDGQEIAGYAKRSFMNRWWYKASQAAELSVTASA